MTATSRAGWQLNLYREAGEAGGSFHGLDRARSSAGGWWEPGPDWDPGLGSDRSVDAGLWRAQRHVRRYCAANGLTRLGTLTYGGEGEHDPRAVRGDLHRFFRGVRRRLGGERFPYLWVPELHPGGHGWHVHFVVGRYVPWGLVKEAWGRGHVSMKLIQGVPVGSGVRGEARMAARYVSKYLGKEMGGAGGLNRYDVAQGFQPSAEGITGPTEAGVIAEACERMGGQPDYVWRSVTHEGWRGPQAVSLRWR